MRHPRVWVRDNPLMSFHVAANIRSCMRQPYWKLFLATFLLIFAYWVYQVVVTGMVMTCVVIEMVITCLVAVQMTYYMMAMEFEKETWDALVMSPLSAEQIVFVKLVSRVFMLGGVNA